MIPKYLLAATIACFVAAFGGGAAQAQSFPSRTITIVSPYAPGATDQQVRALAPGIQRLTGQSVVIENRVGAGGAIGARGVATASPDGYTLLYSAPAVLTILPLIQNTSYQAADFTPIARLTRSPHLMAVRTGAPFSNLKEVIAYSKENPGTIKFGSSGTGTAVHIAGEAFTRAAGITVMHVPFRGLNDAITQVLAGNVDLVIGVPLTIMPLVQDGRMKAVAQFGAERSPLIPDVPTLKEQGVDVALSVDLGFFGPKGMDPALVEAIDRLIAEAMSSDEFKAYVKTGVMTSDYLPGPEYARVVEAEAKVQAEVLRSIGMIK